MEIPMASISILKLLIGLRLKKNAKQIFKSIQFYWIFIIHPKDDFDIYN